MAFTVSSRHLRRVRSVVSPIASGRHSFVTGPAITGVRAKHYKVVCVGGGAGGIACASSLSKTLGKGQVGVIEPSKMHYYQPMWTMVGGGFKDVEDSIRPTIDVMPRDADWIRDRAVEFLPEENAVVVGNGDKVTYDYLIVAAGIQINWDKVKGLSDALGKNGVCSNYSPKHCTTTWKFMQDFQGGTALFTQPTTPIKCAGAPQKVMYIFEDRIRQRGLRDKTDIHFMQGMGKIFGIEKYANALSNVCKDRGIHVNLCHELVEVKGGEKKAVFRHTETGEEKTVAYEFMHVTPPMSAPDFIAKSPLAASAGGWVDVDAHTLQHVRYSNVFSLGDCSSAPTSKTVAAVADESRVVKANLLSAMAGEPLTESYEGYASCPLVTGTDRLILAEFSGYTGKPMETFFWNQAKENWFSFFLKKDIMPELYWDGLLKGIWEGPKHVRMLMNPFKA